MDKIQKAKEIALKDLRACYKKWGVFASLVNFSDDWARDSFWAVFGMLEIGDFKHAKKTLELFMKYQRKSGKISRKISSDFNRLKYLFKIKIKRATLKPVYASPLRSRFAMDGNLLFVMAFCQYVKKTSDHEFARSHFLKVRSALEFYQAKKMIRGCLLDEYGLSSWMDTVFKKGLVLYTNCLWFEAVRQFEIITELLGYARSEQVPPANLIKKSIQDTFWLPNKNFFADSVSDKNIAQEYFDLAGNVLAILFDVSDQKQTDEIFLKIDSIAAKESDLHPVNDPMYPWWKINPCASLAGIYRYHNGISWSWTEALLVAARARHGKIQIATNNLTNFSSIIIKNKHIHETYNLNGQPFGNFFWKSAVPFAWSSGLFLYAVKKYEEAIQG